MVIDGYNEGEITKPPSPAEIARHERAELALNTWRASGSIKKVRDALGGVSERVARVAVNRALSEHREAESEEREAVKDFVRQRFLSAFAAASERVEEGDVMRIAEMARAGERLAKLWDLDMAKDAPEGPQIVVIEARKPWEREEITDTTAEDVPEIEGPPEPPDGE